MKKAFSITIDEELYTRLKEKAEDENRTVSNVIETILRELLEE